MKTYSFLQCQVSVRPLTVAYGFPGNVRYLSDPILLYTHKPFDRVLNNLDLLLRLHIFNLFVPGLSSRYVSSLLRCFQWVRKAWSAGSRIAWLLLCETRHFQQPTRHLLLKFQSRQSSWKYWFKWCSKCVSCIKTGWEICWLLWCAKMRGQKKGGTWLWVCWLLSEVR